MLVELTESRNLTNQYGGRVAKIGVNLEDWIICKGIVQAPEIFGKVPIDGILVSNMS
jgi:hypothetical protein